MNSQPRKWIWAGALAAAAIGLVFFLFDPARVPIYPVCLFHRWTGLNCPGCGSLRALHQLAHGHIVQALHFNALLVLSLPLFAWWLYRSLKQRYQAGPPVVIRQGWLWFYLGLWLAFGILRELPVPLFASFSP